MKETMTVHEALCEIKMLNKRISGAIENSNPIATKEHSSKQVNGMPVEDFIAEAKANHQSAMDLIRRLAALKAAVNHYNAEKIITVGDKEYSIAQAIYMMEYGLMSRRDLMTKYTTMLNNAKKTAAKANSDDLNRRAENAMNAIYGAKEKSDPETYLNGLKAYKEQHTLELVDPLNLAKVIEDLGAEIETFESKVDAAIQKANATTEITIDY